MSFVSLEFLVLMGVVVAAYHRLKHRWQNWLLLAASYVFYGWWDWRFLGLILASSLVDFLCGKCVDRKRSPELSERARKFCLVVSLGANLGALGFFKYYNFFVDSAGSVLESLGIGWGTSTLSIILPIGISFYTFQTMSYTIDVYRGRLDSTDRLGDFLLFVSFFPQLVAGPIERASHLLPQIQKPREVRADTMASGVQLMLFGFFKKMVIADNLGLFVDSIFENPHAALNGPVVLLALLAFSFQIYGDFSGYTDIARGAARVLGFDLCQNFRMPYLATNPSDFWQRWHVSLSTWLRDYLYIPLGGNQKGKARTGINLCITMLLGGLWHGAAWNFVLWGAYHGLLLLVFHLFVPRRDGRAAGARVRGGLRFWIKVLAFFGLTLCGWLLFRVTSIHQLGQMVVALGEWGTPTQALGPVVVMLLLTGVPLMAMDIYRYYAAEHEPWTRWGVLRQVGFNLALFYAIVCFGTPYATTFIYFQF